MNINTKAFVVAATVGLGGATGASAGLIDFTNNATVAGFTNAGGSGTVTVGSDLVNWTLTASPEALNVACVNVPDNCPGPVGPLAGQNDGLGIHDDELTNTGGVPQSITIAFSTAVKVTALYFLDLFIGPAGTESALVSVDGAAPVEFFATADSAAPDVIGFGAFATSLDGKVFKFTVGAGNDIKTGDRPDYALAGLAVAPIPLPAGVLLLGTALAGLGFARRRKSA